MRFEINELKSLIFNDILANVLRAYSGYNTKDVRNELNSKGLKVIQLN